MHSRIAQTCAFRVYCSQTNLYLDDCEACTCSSNPETKAMISRQCACFLSCLAESPAWIMALCVFRVLPALLYGETIGFQSIGFHVNNRLPHGFSFVMILVSKATVFKSLSAIFRLHLKEF